MLTVQDVVKDLSLVVLAGHEGLEREIKAEMLSRPGVELAGFMDFFDAERLMLIGSKEKSFLSLLPVDIQIERIEKLFEKKPPGVIFSVNVEVDPIFIQLGNQYYVPILKSSVRTTPLNSHLYSYLHQALAERKSVHGVLLDIHGMGTLIVGKSGIGKSETALELIKRGHLLISDDRVDIYEAAPNLLVGTAPDILKRYIEVRGIGIVDVVHMFGVGTYRESKRVRLMVELEMWDQSKSYDRLGLEYETVKIFNTSIVKMTIPVLPGRNVATLVESAAMNLKLNILGHNAAKDLTEAVKELARKNGVDHEKMGE